MIKSMTGFGSREAQIAPLGKICVELRSSNHKFLETVFHLPDGFLALEGNMKKEIEARIKRGRVTCALNFTARRACAASVNRPLLKEYVSLLKGISKQYGLKDEISANTLIHLPGVLAVEESDIPKAGIWMRLKALVDLAVEDLDKTRQKEGRALYHLLKNRAEALRTGLVGVKIRFRQAVKDRLSRMKTDEERNSFLKESDITEEIDRLAFHIRNFKSKLAKSGSIGKELDFIAQEMQREINTLAAKASDIAVSAKAVQIRSQVEKIREQVQNIE